jgi:hypothetical protein
MNKKIDEITKIKMCDVGTLTKHIGVKNFAVVCLDGHVFLKRDGSQYEQ